MKLVGDVGGTKVLLALVDERGDLHEKRRLASADFQGFDELLAAYRSEVRTPVRGACLAVAGPVTEGGRKAKITNLPWHLDADALAQRFQLGEARLANDFAAVAAGVSMATAAQYEILQSGAPAGPVQLVIGAGTGLGVAALVGETILPSEGGHVGFAPADAAQAHLWSMLMAEFGRVTAERVISGPGLTAIHRVLHGESDTPESIGARALAGEDAASATVELFFACYGAFAGDLALAFLARGGVYLAGGVTQKLLPLLRTSHFLCAFNAKAEHAGLVAAIPVLAVTDPDIGLRGAARLARDPS